MPPTTPTSLDIVTLGEAMVMLVADEPGPLEQVQHFHKRTAGAETNVAIGLARLGLRVGWASRLGEDSMGRYLLGEMRREGIDCSQVAVVAGERTGFQFKGAWLRPTLFVWVEAGRSPQAAAQKTSTANAARAPRSLGLLCIAESSLRSFLAQHEGQTRQRKQLTRRGDLRRVPHQSWIFWP